MEWCLPSVGDSEVLFLYLILNGKDSGLTLILLEREGGDRAVTSPPYQALLLEDSGGAKALLLSKVEGESGRVPPPPP